jgi:hypothetical protein
MSRLTYLPLCCDSEPAFFAGEESAVRQPTSDSSRNKTALLNDNF